MNRLLIIVATLIVGQCLYCREYNCDSIGYSSDDYVVRSDRKNCPPDSIYYIYTYAVVKDTFLMDLIIDKVNYVLENDSICNLIKNEYFHHWNRNRKPKSIQITTICKNGLPLYDQDINEKFIPDGFDHEILNKKLLTVSVLLDYYHKPFGAFYSNYKGNTYYFFQTLLVTPTKKKLKKLTSNDYDVTHMYDFIELQFFYYKGELYLDPTINTWHCYQ